MIYAPEGSRLHTPENQAALRSISAMEHAMHTGMILEARAVLCDSSHNLAGFPCRVCVASSHGKRAQWASQKARQKTSH